MLKLQCRKCNFEFEKKKVPIRWPNCRAEGTIILYKIAQKYILKSRNKPIYKAKMCDLLIYFIMNE